MIHQSLSALTTLLPGLGNHLWQSTLFAAAASVLAIVFRKYSARVRYWLWTAASVKLLVPFSLLMQLGTSLAWTSSGTGVAPSAYFAIQEIGQPFSPRAASSISSIASFPAAPQATL